MRALVRLVVRVLVMYDRHGLAGVASFVVPVYWSQDVNMVNGGYDLVTFRRRKGCYTRATYRDSMCMWQGLKEDE